MVAFGGVAIMCIMIIMYSSIYSIPIVCDGRIVDKQKRCCYFDKIDGRVYVYITIFVATVHYCIVIRFADYHNYQLYNGSRCDLNSRCGQMSCFPF